MKSFAFLVAFIQVAAMAQVSTSGFPKFESRLSNKSAEGFRVGVFKTSYEAKVKFTQTEFGTKAKAKGTVDLDQGNGLSVGYVSIPLGSVGFAASANYIELVIGDRSSNIVRLEGNGTFALNRNVYGKAGPNFTQFVSKGAKRIKGDFGFQAGVGVQVTQNVGVDLLYSQNNLDTKFSDPNFSSENEIAIQGLEIGLTGTF